jgi:hypothetical protein
MGVGHDIAAMAQVLAERGFRVDRCGGPEATRAGVLGAYERLISATATGDAVVVYYSGHGGSARSRDDGQVLQFIAPVDYHETRTDDFRGITSLELSALLTRLTARTANATVILDCCHAGRMSRDPSLRTRALAEPATYEDVRAHVDKLQRAGTLVGEQSRSGGNPHAVRIVACAPGESAYEYRGRAGLRIGMLTEALVEVLAELGIAELGGERITWAAVMDRVRRRVLELEPAQRPEAEGPSRRFVFDTAQDDADSALRVLSVDAGRARLECAALLGVRPGDEFVVMPPGSTEADPSAAVGELVVDAVGPRYAEGGLALCQGRSRVPLGARAFRTAMSVPAFPVSLPVGDPRAADLIGAVAASPSLRVVGSDERWLASVLIDERGEPAVGDRLGPLHSSRLAGPEAVGAVLRDLRALARASALLQSAGGTDWRLGVDVSVEWGTVRSGERHRLPGSGAAMRVGEHVYVEVGNNSAQDVFVSLVDIGASSAITVLTQDSPSGVLLAPGRRFVFGATGFDGALIGEPLGWPAGLDPAVARPETLLVLVSASPHDVSALEQDGAHPVGVGRRPGSPLARMLGRVTRVGGRIAVPEEELPGPSDGYDIHVVEFELGMDESERGRRDES